MRLLGLALLSLSAVQLGAGVPTGGNCSIARHRPQGSLCSVAACKVCGKLLPSLMIIGSIKTGTSSLWAHLVDHTEGTVVSGGTTPKGEISRKEKDFFGDPSQWRMGRAWYEKVWPACPARGRLTVGVDATPAYHVWYDAPKNMAAFFGPVATPRLRLVWLLRDPVAKYWSYFWELKSYGEAPPCPRPARPRILPSRIHSLRL